MAIADRVRELVLPFAQAASVEIYDVEHHGGMVRVLVDADGGVDLHALAKLSRSVSRALDEQDLIDGRYTLEVSSPGLERPLRTPDHFRRAAGCEVKVKTRPGFDGPRRFIGVLEAVADEGVDVRDADGHLSHIAFEQLASARTVFEWEPGRRHSKRSPRVHAEKATSHEP